MYSLFNIIIYLIIIIHKMGRPTTVTVYKRGAINSLKEFNKSLRKIALKKMADLTT